MGNEQKIKILLDKFNDELYNHDELWEIEKHIENEKDGKYHYEFCCYKIYRDGNLSPIKYEFQNREYIYSDNDMINRLEIF